MKIKILQEFLNSTIKIKSIKKLEQYIYFCIENNQGHDIQSKTEYHHILPGKIFPNFEKIKTLHKWNGSYLLHKDHYMAHSLLAEALDNFSMTLAWWGMNNKNTKSGKITEPEKIIGSERYTILREEACKSISDWYKKEIIVDGIKTTNAIEHSKKLNYSMEKIINFEGTSMSVRRASIIKRHRNETSESYKKHADNVAKIMMEEFKNDEGEITTIAKERSKKLSKTMSKEFLKKGEITTIYKEAGKKRSKTMNKPFILNGKETSKAKEAGKKLSLSKLKKSKIWDIFDNKDNIVESNIRTKELKTISQALPGTSKEKRLGHNIYSINNLKKAKKEHLIGYYAVEIK